jgi:hypothetical protein
MNQMAEKSKLVLSGIFLVLSRHLNLNSRKETKLLGAKYVVLKKKLYSYDNIRDKNNFYFKRFSADCRK